MNKKFLILTLFIISLFAVSAVSAADNATGDLCSDDGLAEVNDNDLSCVNYDENVLETSQDALTQSDDVKKDVNLTANYQVGIYGNKDTKLKVEVKDMNGSDVTGGKLTFVDVFGEDYTVDVINGSASSSVFVGDVGTFNITCNYVGNDNYNNANATFILYVPVANTTCTNIVATKYNDTVYFSGNVVADYRPFKKYGKFDDTEEVTEGNVTVYVDGQLLGMCDVDVNGNYVYIWKTTQNLIGKTINFTGVFTNNLKHYNSSKFSENFTFEASKGTEISYNITVIDENDILINGIVIDENGNPVTGGTMTVNGVYSIPVDTNGKFKLHVTNKTVNNASYEIGFKDFGSKADITINEPLMNGIRHTALVDELIDLCKKGSPYIKFGNGNGKTIIVNVGTHGGELSPQVAGFKLIDLLANYGDEINGTLYVFPTIFPEATANNVRIYNGINLNVVADKNGSISNNFVKFARSVNASGLGDFHSTRHSDNDVGITCAMGSYSPTFESSEIANYIGNQTGYKVDLYDEAGVPYAGAIEDYSNILGGPAVTCEVLTNHKAIEYGTPEISYNMMRAFLNYFGYDIDDMVSIPSTENLSFAFESPYNYNSSYMNVTLPVVQENAKIVAKSANYVINYGGEYSIVLKDSKDNPISGEEVTFILKGKKIGSAVTDSEGVATIKITSKALKTAKAGKRNLVIKFNCSDYKPVNKTVKVTINKEKVKATAKAKTFKKSVKTKKYTITLKNSKNKAIKNAKVTIKVNKKTYSAKTNSNGKATFKITKLTKKGKFTSTITYKGDSYYKKLTKKVKISVK
jgi:predicted deacylase